MRGLEIVGSYLDLNITREHQNTAVYCGVSNLWILKLDEFNRFHKYFMFYNVYRCQIAESVKSDATNNNTQGQVKGNTSVEGPPSDVRGDPHSHTHSRDRNRTDMKKAQNYPFETGRSTDLPTKSKRFQNVGAYRLY
jgi:hypothetical protein